MLFFSHVLLFIIAVYGVLLCYLYLHQNRLVFKPTTDNPFWHDHKPFRSFIYETPTGLKERGLWAAPQADNPTLIYFHGNSGHVGGRLYKAKKLLAKGYGIALVEYRGYGGNPGVPSESNLLEDARAAIKAVHKKGIAYRDMVLYGESLGTGVATQIALEMPKVKALILEAPYTSVTDVAARRYWYLPVRRLVKDRFENDAKIAGLKMPILILHGDQDKTIPIAFGKKLFALVASEIKVFHEIAGGGHTDLYDYTAEEAVHEFLENLAKIFSLTVMLLLTAWSCQAQTLYPLTIHTQKSAQMFQVELANTPETLAKGLMDRKDLAPDHGMLFVFPLERDVAFWMHDTLILLDMVFIKADGTVSHIHEMAKPMDETPIPSEGVIKAVLEIAGGQAAAQGVKIGDNVETSLLQEKAE